MNKLSQKGIVNILFVIFLAALATFVVATIQSRLLLAIHRNRSYNDILISQYDAESNLYDILARIKSGFSIKISDFDGQKLDDGTLINVTEIVEPGKITYSIMATRPYAVFNLEAVKTTVVTGSPGKASLILSLDCSESMKDKADPAQADTHPTRMEAEIEAAIEFIGAIHGSLNHENLSLGIMLFNTNAIWLTDLSNIPIEPDSMTDANYQRIYDTLISTSKFDPPSDPPKDPKHNPACNGVGNSGTSQGSGLAAMHDYFINNPPPIDTIPVEILATDGVPFARISDNRCPPSPASPPGKCTAQDCARDYFACTLATPAQTYNSEWKAYAPYLNLPGIRDPILDTHVIIFGFTQESLASDNFETKKILDSYALGKYYVFANANELTDKLIAILNGVQNSVSTITIRRVL